MPEGEALGAGNMPANIACRSRHQNEFFLAHSLGPSFYLERFSIDSVLIPALVARS